MERKQTTIRLPPELKTELQKEAQKRGYPVKDLVLMIIHGYLAKVDLPHIQRT